MIENSGPRPGRSNRWSWLLALPPLLLAAAIYRPWRILPFDVPDFVDFMPILTRTAGFWARCGALLQNYAKDGRMNPLFYVTFDVFYSIFGTAPAGWQLVRFAVMAVDVVLVLFLLRRLGVGRIAALSAACLLVAAMPAVRTWMMLMAEPQALLALVIAAYLAFEYGTTRHWKRSAAAIMALVAFVFLSKEIVGSLGIVIVGVALFWTDGSEPRAPLFSRRNAVLVVGVALVAVAEAVMLVIVRSEASSTGYGMMYGTGSRTLARLFEIVLAILLPVRPGLDSRLGLLFPANVLAIVVMALGATTYHRRGGSLRRLGIITALGLFPVLLGALLYWPWPLFNSFYALPFFVGPLLLFAAALNELIQARGSRRVLGIVAACLVPLYTAVAANRTTESATASLRLNIAFAHLMVKFEPEDTLFILDPGEAKPDLRPVSPDGLRDYAVMFGWTGGRKGPVVLSPACDEYPPDSTANMTHRAYGSYSYRCGKFPNPAIRMASPYTWRDWLTFSAHTDTLVLDLNGGLIRERLFGKRPELTARGYGLGAATSWERRHQQVAAPSPQPPAPSP